MKLRNKKTGEIVENVWWDKEADALCLAGNHLYFYNSLAELNEEWGDYEEEGKYWFIDCGKYEVDECEENEDTEVDKEIGNYFKTKEEAEKAVEKLKAWKRLKDKGFKFEGWDNTDRSTIHNFSLFVAIEDLDSINKDLDLLFGGEE